MFRLLASRVLLLHRTVPVPATVRAWPSLVVPRLPARWFASDDANRNGTGHEPGAGDPASPSPSPDALKSGHTSSPVVSREKPIVKRRSRRTLVEPMPTSTPPDLSADRIAARPPVIQEPPTERKPPAPATGEDRSAPAADVGAVAPEDDFEQVYLKKIDATELVDTEKLPPEVVASRAIVQHGRRGDPAAAQREFDAAVQRGVQPNRYMFGSLISAYARSGLVADAERVLRQMQAAGIQPETAEYNLLVRASVTAGRVSQGLAWVRNMRRRGIPCDITTFTNLLPACRTRGQITRTVDVLRELYDRQYLPSTQDLAALTRAYAHARERFVSLLVNRTTVRWRLLRAAARHRRPVPPHAVRTAGVPPKHSEPAAAGQEGSGTAAAAAAAAVDATGGSADRAGAVADGATEPQAAAAAASAGSAATPSDRPARHPTLLQSLLFEPSAELLERLRPAGRKRARAMVQQAVQRWAVEQFELAFRPRETVESFGWRLLRPRKQDTEKPLRKRLPPPHPSDRWRDRKNRGKPMRLILKERAQRIEAAKAKRARQRQRQRATESAEMSAEAQGGQERRRESSRLPPGGGVVTNFAAEARKLEAKERR